MQLNGLIQEMASICCSVKDAGMAIDLSQGKGLQTILFLASGMADPTNLAKMFGQMTV